MGTIARMYSVIVVLAVIVFGFAIGLECSKTTTEIVIEDKWSKMNYGCFDKEFYFADQEGNIYKITRPNPYKPLSAIKKYDDLPHIRFEKIQEGNKYLITYTNLGFRCSIEEELIGRS